MSLVTIVEPGRPARTIELRGALTTIGCGADHHIPLEDASTVGCVVALEEQQGLVSAWSVEGPPMLVAGRKVSRLRLKEGDAFQVGRAEIRFHHEAPRPAAPVEDDAPVEALRELHRFSETLLSQPGPDHALEALVDGVVRLTKADKGLLVLVEPEGLAVRVARGIADGAIADGLGGLSDTILRRVLETRRPLVISDALHDRDFNGSASVVRLSLLSVMCVPLLDAGEVFGLLYVGNDRVTARFDERALALVTIYAAQASLIVRNARLVQSLSRENAALKEAAREARFGDVVGSCDAMQELFRRIDKVAKTDVPVLVTGETGTGKELVARELHRRSPRGRGPFVAINCGAIPEGLLESELFGHVKGAFTGAVQTRIGRFQAASGGTLFLDEVAELSPALQVKLLRALQERVVTKVGDVRPENVDIRVVAATNRLLEEDLRTGRFRQDLYYRLNVVRLHLPPLRDRGGDVDVLVRHLLARIATELSRPVTGLSDEAMEAVRRAPWPGNVRELENRLRKAVVLADGPLLTLADLDLVPAESGPVLPLAEAVEAFKERYVDEVLQRNDDNRARTARDLGVDARTIFRTLERKRARLEGRDVDAWEEP
jgi:transcriptional regulator with GAF, ATPase, and Fis domain